MFLMRLREFYRNKDYRYLAICFGLAFIFHLVIGNLSPRIVPDSAGYLQLGSWNEIAGSARTPFYGWLSLLFEWILPGYVLLPWLSLISIFIAGFLVNGAALYYGMSRRAALAFAVVIPFSNSALLFMGYVHPEILSISCMLIALSGVLRLARGTHNDWLWYLVTSLSLGISYLLKPGFILFVVFFPLLFVLLSFYSGRFSFFRVIKRGVLLFVLAALPFLLYSSARYLEVNDFNLVSFAGVNGLGLSGQILDQETISKLPEQHKAMAERIISGRKIQEKEGVILPIPINSSNGERVYWSAVIGYFDVFARNYDRITDIGKKDRYDEESWVEFNRRAGYFNRSVIFAEPLNYFLYIFGASTRFVGLLLSANAMFVLSSMLFLSVLMVRLYVDLKNQVPMGRRGGLFFEKDLIPLFLIIFVVVVASYIPSVAVAFPARRYVDTAGILLPALPLYLSFCLLRSK